MDDKTGKSLSLTMLGRSTPRFQENDENFQQDYRDRLEEMRAPLTKQREAAETRDDTGRSVGEPTGVRTE